MRLRFLSADAQGRIDGVLHDRLWSHISNFVNENEDVVIVGISYFSDFSVNPELYKLRGKKWILCDTMEYYSQWPDGKSHLFGISDTSAFGGNDQWKVFCLFVKENPPILQFVRELYKEDVSKFIQPIEWPCYQGAWELEPKLNFDSRPIEVFYNWGFSSCSRPELHGEIYKNWCKRGYEVIGNFDHIESKLNEPIRKWCSIHTPHSHRRNINEISRWQALSKLTVSMPGAARKCFRSTEAPLHSIMALMDDNLAWSHPWEHGKNCVRMTEGNEVQNLESAIKTEDLHPIYLESQKTLDLYRTNNYIHNHILPSIERVL